MMILSDHLSPEQDAGVVPVSTAANHDIASVKNGVEQLSDLWVPVLPSSTWVGPMSNSVVRKSSLSSASSGSSSDEFMTRSSDFSPPSLNHIHCDTGDQPVPQMFAPLDNASDKEPDVVEATAQVPLPPPAPPLPTETRKSLFAADTMVPRPSTPTKRLQWTKIPASRVVNVGRPTVWAVVGRILNEKVVTADQPGRCSPDFECLEQLFSLQTATGGSLNGTASPHLHGQSSTTRGQPSNWDGVTSLDRRRKPDEVCLLECVSSFHNSS